MNSSCHSLPVFTLLNAAWPTTLTTPLPFFFVLYSIHSTSASLSTTKPSMDGNVSLPIFISRVSDSFVKYSSQPRYPMKVLPRSGNRDVAHDGPCSVIRG